MSKKTEKANTSFLAKAAQTLGNLADELAKGAIDLDAKDYESQNYDGSDTRVRGRRARNVADTGNGYSAMEPTPAELEDLENDAREPHRVLVTGKPAVHGGSAENDELEDPEDADVGDEEWYEHTHPGARHPNPRNPHYGKSEGYEKEDDEDEDDDKKSFAGAEDMSKSAEAAVYDELLTSPEFAEIVESSAVVEHMANVMGKSFGNVHSEISTVKRALGIIAKSQQALIELLANTPAKAVAPGILGKIGDRVVNVSTGSEPEVTAAPIQKGNMVNADAAAKSWHRNTMMAIERAVSAGDINPDCLTRFDVDGLNVVKSLPEDTKTKYGIKLPN